MGVTETASITLGAICVIAWTIAEIPQLITNYREKSSEGLSVAFLMTWLIGDLFNIVGCLLEPATLQTQLYTAVLYTIITIALFAQTIYYGHIYPRLKSKGHFKIDSPIDAEQSKNGVENASDSNQGTCIGLSSPIPLPKQAETNYVGLQSYHQSPRYISKSHTPRKESFLAQRLISPHSLNPEEVPLLCPSVSTQSASSLKIKNTLCLVSALTFLGAFNLFCSPNARSHSVVSKPRQEYVIYVGRNIFQVSGHELPEHDVKGNTGIGTWLGWAMAFMYTGGRLPQICLNIRRGNFEGVNPLLFLFALIGNGTYIASILVRGFDWSRIGPNLPWLVESGGCVILDTFILMQFLYFRFHVKYKCQSVPEVLV